MQQSEYGESYFNNSLRACYEVTDLLRQNIDILPVGSRVLELGCGDLQVLKAILEIRPDLDLHGVDIGDIPTNSVPACIKFTQIDYVLYETDLCFDLVLAIDVLEHLPLPQKMIEKANHLLKSGGKLYVNVPSVTKLFLFGAENFYSDYTHLRPFSSKGLTRMLQDYSFSLLHMETGAKTGPRHLPRFAYYVMRGLLTLDAIYINAAIRLLGGTAIEAVAQKGESR